MSRVSNKNNTVSADDIVDNGYDYYGSINESAIDKAANEGKTSSDGSVAIWSYNQNPVLNDYVNGLDFVIDTENATTGKTAKGTKYVSLGLNNIIGGALTKADIPASNPLTFIATGLTIAGMVGLAFKLENGEITGGSFKGTKGSVIIGSMMNRSLAYGEATVTIRVKRQFRRTVSKRHSPTPTEEPFLQCSTSLIPTRLMSTP